jgi:hypothetical protein
VTVTIEHEMETVMLAVVNCWNHTDLFKTRDLLFTRLGVLPYSREDDKRMANRIRQQIGELEKEKDIEPMKDEDADKVKRETMPKKEGQENQQLEIKMSHEDYLKAHFNLVQNHIVSFLSPIAERKVDWIIHKLLNIWGDSRSFARIGININEGYEKII